MKVNITSLKKLLCDKKAVIVVFVQVTEFEKISYMLEGSVEDDVCEFHAES